MTLDVNVFEVDVCARVVAVEVETAREDDCVEVFAAERVRVPDLPDELDELLPVAVDEETVEEVVVELDGP